MDPDRTRNTVMADLGHTDEDHMEDYSERAHVSTSAFGRRDAVHLPLLMSSHLSSVLYSIKTVRS